MHEIRLIHNNGYRWYESSGIFVKGFVVKEDKIYSDGELSRILHKIESREDLIEFVKSSAGLFSMIIAKNDSIKIVSDITRTFPIFYSVVNGNIIISDDTFFMKNSLGSDLDQTSSIEFLRCGYVTGRYTLLNNIRQVQAGEIVSIDSDGKVVYDRYHDYTVAESDLWVGDYELLKSDFIRVLDRSISRLIKYASGLPIVIPLSGGYDSRAIAAMLKKKNYENIICYTYGRPDSSETLTAEKVAKKLDIEWHFIEQNEDLIDENFLDEKWFNEFFRFAFNHVSTVHLQDLFVFKYLHEGDVIPKDSIIVPGHTGDFLRGDHLKKVSIPNDANEVLRNIIAKHYTLNEHIEMDSNLKNRIIAGISEFPIEKLPYSIDDNWDMKERQAKFIINSNRTYEFFGYRHALPLWDSDLVDFFRRLPIQYKIDKVLYREALVDRVFKELGISEMQSENAVGIRSKFYFKVFHSLAMFRYLRLYGERYLPYSLKRFVKDAIWKDENNLRVVVMPIASRINRKYYFSEATGIVADWCLKTATIG